MSKEKITLELELDKKIVEFIQNFPNKNILEEISEKIEDYIFYNYDESTF